MSDPLPEFTRPLELDRIGEIETTHDFTATVEECAALAERFSLLGIDKLTARLKLRRTRGRALVRLTGHFAADVVQACVVTVEPVPAHIEQDFAVLYGDIDSGAEVLIDPEQDTDLEPLPEGALDLGEIVAQELALALDPYPRSPGAALSPAAPPGGEEAAPEKPQSPFADLVKLKKTKD
jgi:uncharacterized metal-binding protein YceD (DUF177 family)